jgi:hypothetical protein
MPDTTNVAVVSLVPNAQIKPETEHASITAKAARSGSRGPAPLVDTHSAMADAFETVFANERRYLVELKDWVGFTPTGFGNHATKFFTTLKWWLTE